MNHSFNVEVAMEYGLEESILLENLVFWCNKNRANEKNFHDGFYWTYNSVKAFCELFPYLTKAKITTALKNLEEKGLIKTGNYNTSKYDHTLWYAVTRKGFSFFNTSISEFKKSNISESEISITDINTDNKPYVNNSAKARPENKKEMSDSQKLKKIYLDNYHELYREGCVKKESPVINWGVAIHNLNEAVEKFGYDDIEKAIIKSKNDDFCIKNGYALTTILSYGVLSGLINSTGKGANKHYGTSLCSQTCDVVTDEDLKNIRF